MSVQTGFVAAPPTRPPTRAVGRTLWSAYDLALAALAVLASTEALNRFGPVASVVWLSVYGLVLARVALTWRAFFPVLRRNLVYFAYPAICLASVLWSASSSSSLTAGIQMAMTVLISVVIGWRFSLVSIVLVQGAVISGAVLLSLANWLTGVFGTVYAPAGGLLGIFSQKNALGQRALVGALCALALLLTPARDFPAIARRHIRLVWLGALGMLVPIALAITLSASVTSILMLPVAAGVLLLASIHRLPRGLIMTGAAVAVLALSIGPLALALSGFDLVGEVLGAFGKDSSLTGRTGLWSIGLDVIDGRALLGVGYQSFWSSPSFANYALLAQHYGAITALGFHNFILEVLVGTGIVGLVAMLALIGTTLWRAWRLLAVTRSPAAGFALAATLLAIPLSLIGTSLYRQHEFTIMLIVMLGVAAGKDLRVWRARSRA